MNEIFVDTSGWANYFVRTEPFHLEAKQLMRQWHHDRTQALTTNYVLLELAALFISPFRIPRRRQIQAIEAVKTADWIEIVHIDKHLDDEAWQLFKNREDKMWSLVDCSSFVIMKRRRVIRGFTTDHHFEQAGFQRLLNPGL
ncbi:VapC toxin family PIN domain ribonuclease [Candidatus Desulfarcum epimagneticum]|uniref:VapC toxin family PIN domain ribonuclease n=1 Tax=uncultured Desulfobacteraceae bacterium TaxID=218296 RepID=A0A484HHU0_9BACT|nr:VapC toxin family PIN domain ribonuclease [uncultured Desulfobacteraceae bacterium]